MARLAFTNWKLKIRSNLAISHAGPETLEEAVQDYINRNTDLVDLPSLVAVSRLTCIYFPQCYASQDERLADSVV